jgi:DNA-binding NarL/FixJ family response regulator
VPAQAFHAILGVNLEAIEPPLDAAERALSSAIAQARTASAPGARPGAAAAVPGLAQHLTARELEILALLAAGTPNPRIAEELVVTLDTSKSTSATC